MLILYAILFIVIVVATFIADINKFIIVHNIDDETTIGDALRIYHVTSRSLKDYTGADFEFTDTLGEHDLTKDDFAKLPFAYRPHPIQFSIKLLIILSLLWIPVRSIIRADKFYKKTHKMN